ncbi:peptide ABC transporter substrate-binding protein [Brevibacillus fulvus]|uniref:Oligopeptide transport system substrate-binding protein n=1 Tax=Brevibacillus fulvus TaxID=1125967 RepID=A0A938Y1U1_9BACL|nr:peptide ABC transporter substrate-binding protein [Brevibacillus fulvus]MBM7591613.1 oligopeptide transport system substrate-binding protein [Brevibacillus fulvus]
MKKHFLSIVSSVLVLSVALAGCGSPGSTDSAASTDSSSSSQGEKVIRLNLHSEPPTADPGLAEDTTSGAVVRATFDGLTRFDKDNKIVPSAAESYEVSDDKLTYTFKLRDAKWSNGDPVTAKDFEFAWKRALDPKTASNYAYQLYYIKNGEKFNKGEAKADDVGVKALDDKTLQVTLEHPTPYFLELTSFYTYYPVNQKVVEVDPKWANEAKTHVGNGPFKLESWEHKNKMVLVKNDNYWDKDTVKLDRIEFSMVEDENTELSMFENGELDWAGSPLSSLPVDAIPALQDQGRIISQPIAGTYFYNFNTEQVPFNNAKIRKAFAYAIDRQAIIDNVTQLNQEPAMGFVPPSMSLASAPYFKDNDVETAKKLLAEGMKELGISKLPPITISFNTQDAHKKIAESIQDQWKKAFNIDVKLSNTEWKVYIEDLHQGKYQVGRNAWLGDFNDPSNFLDLFKEKTTGNNDTGWENEQYKKLLEQAMTDPEDKRKEDLAQAEKILMDEMPIAPIYFYTDSWVKSDKVKDVVIDGLGNVDYKWASVE